MSATIILQSNNIKFWCNKYAEFSLSGFVLVLIHLALRHAVKTKEIQATMILLC